MKTLASILPFVLLATACGSSSPDPVAQVQVPVETPVVEPPAVKAPANVAAVPGAADRTTARPNASTASAADRATFTFKGSIETTLSGDVHTASVELVVVDEQGHPAANVEVHGLFTDGIKAGAVATTNADGIAVATATGAKQHMQVGFKVTGVTYVKDGVRSPGTAMVDLIYPAPCCPLKAPPTN